MMKIAMIVALVATMQAAAISIKWTGYANNGQWDTNNNWYPNSVPGPSDDVTIESGDVTVTTPVSINSLGMGDSFSATANLTVLSTLTVFSTLTVEGNGNLIMSSGASQVSGTINVAGNLVFSAGVASGTWTISKNGNANLAGAGVKSFSGCGFTSMGAVSASGVWNLSQSSIITIQSTLQAAGDFTLLPGDTSSVSVDTSSGTLTYNGGGTLQIQIPVSLGTFNFIAGNLTLLDDVNFVNSFAVPSGSVVSVLGLAHVTMPAGVTGTGVLAAAGQSLVTGQSAFNGTLVAQAGTVSLASGSSVAAVNVAGADLVLSGTLSAGTVYLTGGSIQGGAKDELTASVGVTIATAGFNLNGSLVAGGTSSVTGVVAFAKPNGKFTNNGQLTATAVQIAGPAGSGGFINNGMVTVQDSLAFQNVDVKGSKGEYSVAGTFTVGSNQVTAGAVALTGQGVFSGMNSLIFNIAAVSASKGVVAKIGDYSLKCPKECDGVTTVGIPTSKFSFTSE